MTNTSATSIRPALFACTLSPQPGLTTTTVVSALPATSTSTCPTPDGLDEDPAVPEGVEQADRLGRGERQPAEVAARRHRADEHAGVGGVVLHAHPVAEDGPAGERRRRVDGEHGDLLAARPQVGDQGARQRALAGARRPGQPDRVGVAGQRRGQPADLPGALAAALDERQQPGLGRAVAVPAAANSSPAALRLVGRAAFVDSVDVDDFGDAVDPVAHDPLDPGLQRLGRRRTTDARPDQRRP